MTGYEEILDDYRTQGRLRRIPEEAENGLIDLCSNDYMGLAAKSNVWREEFHTRFGYPAMTSSASRLLSGRQNEFNNLEQWLAKAYGRPALLYNSGYHANIGIISALNISGTLWLTDKLIHASAIDGIRLARAEYKRWNHNDLDQLTRIIEQEQRNYQRIIVVCESIYSMDGDSGPLPELCEIKRRFPSVMLYVDEAHALGCFGKTGLGLCQQFGIIDEVDIIVGTLGKACASTGAFVICSGLIRDYLINNSRSLIFSTALAPVNAAWSQFMLEKLKSMHEERARLTLISKKIRDIVERATGVVNPSSSAIVPVITGDSVKAMALSERLRRRGILSLPIRRPTVPPGGERVRLSLHADLSDREVDYICTALEEEI